MKVAMTITTVLVVLLVLHPMHAQRTLTQDSTQAASPWLLSASAGYGRVSVHTPKINHLQGAYPTGCELELSQWLLTERARQLYNCFPRIGISLNYWNFDHPALGYSLSSLFSLEPFIVSRGTYKLSFKGGFGGAYMSNPYHPTKNPENLTYSTHLSFPVVVAINQYCQLNTSWSIKTSIAFQHISNGGIRKPNLGINYPTFFLGFEKALQPYIVPPPSPPTSYKKNRRLETVLSGGLKHDNDSTPQDMVSGLNGLYSHQVSRINAITGNVFFEYIHRSYLTGWEATMISVLIGNEFLLGKFTFGQQIGCYLKQSESTPSRLLQYYSLHYYFNKHFLAGIAIKAHGQVAEYLGIRIGHVF
jgi:hypothetical protein